MRQVAKKQSSFPSHHGSKAGYICLIFSIFEKYYIEHFSNLSKIVFNTLYMKIFESFMKDNKAQYIISWSLYINAFCSEVSNHFRNSFHEQQCISIFCLLCVIYYRNIKLSSKTTLKCNFSQKCSQRSLLCEAIPF